MFHRLIIILFIAISIPISGQVDAGTDITISAGMPLHLQATYLGYTGLPITAGDDPFVGPFDIGFEFEFFGESHTQFAVSPNGLVSFHVPDIIGVSHQEATPIPNKIFIKTIMGPYQDLFSKPIQPHSNFIYYLTTGTSPNRKLIVGWCESPMFGCASLKATYQIILNESDNSIVNHILSKPECNYLQNRGTHGLNYSNDHGIVIPGRNAESWTANNESWLFEPDGISSYSISNVNFIPELIVPAGKLEWAWYKNNYPAGEMLGNTSSLVVYPLESTTYFVEITLCNGMKYFDDIFVNVIPVPNAFNPNSTSEINRTFKFFSSPTDHIYGFKMYIYNRWGKLVYENDDISEGWDGTQNGNPCNPGVYMWVVYFEAGTEKVTNKGSVTLIR